MTPQGMLLGMILLLLCSCTRSQPGPAPTAETSAPAPTPSPLAEVAAALGPFQGTGAANADDPAIWIHPTEPARSLLFLSDKERGIYVFDLAGAELQHLDFGTSLNNIDVRTRVRLGTETFDVLAANLRGAGKLALLRIDPAARPPLLLLADQNSEGNEISPDSYGFALYRRPRDGALFVFDKSKGRAPIRQWQVTIEAKRVRTSMVRELQDVSIDVAEGFVADDALGFVYFTEEGRGIHKYHADPEHSTRTRLALFATDDGSVADREGLALYDRPDGTGWLVLSSQGNSTFIVYERQGANRLCSIFRAAGATGTDGLDISSAPVPGFPQGFAIIHDDPGSRYFLYDWTAIAATLRPPASP